MRDWHRQTTNAESCFGERQVMPKHFASRWQKVGLLSLPYLTMTRTSRHRGLGHAFGTAKRAFEHGRVRFKMPFGAWLPSAGIAERIGVGFKR